MATANPHTVVVLNSGYPVLMPWLNDVRAVLEVWYPGQECGGRPPSCCSATRARRQAAADLPGPRVRRPDRGPPLRHPGVNGQEFYSEGILVGYRWYDTEPDNAAVPVRLRPVLHHVRLRPPQVRQLGRGARSTRVGARQEHRTADRHRGRAGLRRPAPHRLPTPVKQLAGFARVTLQPGESRT